MRPASASPTEGVVCVTTGPEGEARSVTRDDWLAEEEPLELRLDGDPFVTTMRTPGADRELAAGLLVAEGIISSRADILKIVHCGDVRDRGYGNVVDVGLAPHITLPSDGDEKPRHRSISSACGVCGHESIAALRQRCRAVEDDLSVTAATITRAAGALTARQPQFRRTGGTHAAALCDAKGVPLFTFEDVGRHNATDKAIGARLLAGPGQRPAPLLVVSGRCSFEIVQKAAMAQVAMVVAVSAPTTLAVSTARELGITLVAFARGTSFNAYTHPHRLELGV